MVAYTSNPQIDPTNISYVATNDLATAFAASTVDELIIDYSAKKIALKVVNNLTTDGVTIKCIYSTLKEIWRTDSTLIKFPFPMGPITDEQFEMINGWNWDKVQTSGAATQNTVELLRTGGWSVLNTSGAVTELWAGVITLGTFAASTDQAYYQQTVGGSATNFKLTNNVNQAIQILSDPNGDGNYTDGYDRRNYLKVFLREYAKSYDQSANNEIGAPTLTYQAYRFPVSNSTDLKITHDDSTVSTATPYTSITVTYLRHTDNTLYNVRGNYDTGGVSYILADVVKDTSNNRWYKCILGYTSGATQPNADSTHWSAYEGERLIGGVYYPFTIIVDADTAVGPTESGTALRTQVYEKVQYLQRQNSDIDSDPDASVIGKTADILLRFVGDTLVTSNGVYVDSFNSADTNDIEFYDALGTKRTHLYVASIRINFGDNLKNDADAKYWMFFTTLPNANDDFGEAGALLVKNASGVDITGNVSGTSYVDWTFDYGNNNQGGRTPDTNADITVVGIGLSNGQYVKSSGTITRSKANSISLTSSLERNYSNP